MYLGSKKSIKRANSTNYLGFSQQIEMEKSGHDLMKEKKIPAGNR